MYCYVLIQENNHVNLLLNNQHNHYWLQIDNILLYSKNIVYKVENEEVIAYNTY
ncbi:hypothetical protein SASK131_19980 [Staphylococcus argenteus]|nr:hypothetical protein TMSFP064_18750 [Staphylococcus argenteus]BCN91502.1 hypothetical protein TMSFP069_18770 [Staphylococcus argenteus]GJF39810.1 hypothetical protein SA19056_20170 [Staphylococcus argenteus]GJF42478.1 hypothetical protein SA19059_21300 [Staphylococcus argenteus]GJF47540.1 hypothetical protein SA19080_20560 [Staphylococcus argenteus]